MESSRNNLWEHFQMTIQIKKLKINRNGPLLEDFEIEPGILNLIYGHNESGKTFLVEGLIEILFKNKKNKLETRDWDITGKIQISGLSEKIESFTISLLEFFCFGLDEWILINGNNLAISRFQ